MHATIRTFGRIIPVDFLHTNLKLVNNTSETQTNNNAVWLFIPKDQGYADTCFNNHFSKEWNIVRLFWGQIAVL